MGALMRAAIHTRYGPPDVVEVREIERPTPGAGDVLVRVRAASVNRADLDLLRPRPSFLRLFIGLRAPLNQRIGCDVAGIVEATGPDVRRFRPGDPVFADLYPYGAGSFAEYVCAPERAFLPIPPAIPFEVAATLPHAAILAIQGLRTRRGRTFGSGARVVIDGAGGNVGPFAIQLAKGRGAEVTAVDHPDKLDFLRSLGADHVVDYTTDDYTRSGERYDWILDVDSHHTVLEARRALRPNGVYVTLGGSTARLGQALAVGGLLPLVGSRRAGLMFWWQPFRREDVETICGLITAGELRSAIDRRYELGEVGDALRRVDDGLARGKVVIEIPEDASHGPG
jgi:NADPH:quinone reductase-like Zn-dependent oxidoreductase